MKEKDRITFALAFATLIALPVVWLMLINGSADKLYFVLYGWTLTGEFLYAYMGFADKFANWATGSNENEEEMSS